MQPFSGNQRPDLLTSLMNMSLVLRLPDECRSSSNVPRLPSFLEMPQNPHVLLTFDKVHNPLRLPRETRSERPKVVRTSGVFHILTWKCVSRHSGVHFCDISTSKSGPTLRCFVHFHLEKCLAPQRRALLRHLNFQKWSERGVFCTFSLRNVLRATTACTFSTSQVPKVVGTWCFVHFDLEMCFAPQRRALFRHLNFQKWSGPGVFCALGNVLRATTACTFSTSQLPKVVRHWCVLYILTWKFASRHNGVQFFITYLASWLRTRRFSEPTFQPSGATNHWKNTVNRDFPTFSRISIFFPSDLSLLSASSLLCFSSVHIVGSLTSKNFLRVGVVVVVVAVVVVVV